jgi:hypothetical protein
VTSPPARRGLFWLLVAGLTFGCSLGTDVESQDIAQLTARYTSGPVSPEYQWAEEYVIEAGEVRFARSWWAEPVPSSNLNTGTWILDTAPEEIASVFDQLGDVDPSSIEEIEPEHPVVGGGSAIYTIEYEDSSSLIADFLDSLTLPPDAVERFSAALGK